MFTVATSFGQRLTELREAAGLTKYGLAKKSGVTAQTIANIENGATEPAWPTVQKLARALGVSVAAFDDDGEKPAKKK